MCIYHRVRSSLINGSTAEVRGEEVERGSDVGVGHRGGELRYLPHSHHGPLHRVPSKPTVRYKRRLHSGLGSV